MRIIFFISLATLLTSTHVIAAKCEYYNYGNRYTCDLVDSSDINIITGTHRHNHTDADVLGFFASDDVEIPKLSDTITRKFYNLEDFALGKRGITEIASNAFESCSKLERIYLGNNKIDSLPSGLFKNCVNLETLQFMDSPVKHPLPSDLFGNITNLKVFDFSDAVLKPIPEDIFGSNTGLVKFYVKRSSLGRMKPNLLKKQTNLEVVHLGGNHLRTQSYITELIDGLTKLRIIHIGGNGLTEFDLSFFKQFETLETIEISNNNIEHLDFTQLPSSLLNLHASSNELSFIPANAFGNLVNLEFLTLSNNKLSSMYPDTFNSLTKLEKLWLHENNINELHPDTFKSLTNLQILNLRDNEIEELPAGIFTPLTNLGNTDDFIPTFSSDLSIAGNNIKRLDSNAFGFHPNLTYLHINYNKIDKIEPGFFDNFPNLRILEAGSNKCVDNMYINTDFKATIEFNQCYSNWGGEVLKIERSSCGISSIKWSVVIAYFAVFQFL